MAHMLPAAPTEATISRAERVMFRRLKEDCPNDWVIIHSLGMMKHDRKPWAEADFVVINAQGVLVIEVKGGDVARKDMTWTTKGKPLPESPYVQAMGAAAALRRDLIQQIPAVRSAIVGHAVAFPDVSFSASGTDIDEDLTLDVRGMSSDLGAWVSSIFDVWAARLREKNARPTRGLSSGTRAEILNRLAPDFDLTSSIASDVASANYDFVRLTEQQSLILSSATENPRLLIEGGAGTGKTFLAIEEARRAADRGENVLLTCQSKALSRYLRDRVEDLPGVHAQHFHGLAASLIKKANLSSQLPSNSVGNDLFSVHYPRLALEALTQIDDAPIFDCVIVDEAQDLLNMPAMDLVDALVRGGVIDGQWRFFRDPEQDLFDAMDEAACALVDRSNRHKIKLKLNCRNTAQIAAQTAIASGRVLDQTLSVDGPDVEYLEFEDESELRKLIAKTLNRWIHDGIRPQDIVILSQSRRENSALASGLPAGVSAELIDLAGREEVALDRNQIGFATVAGFKGLEADAVILLDAGDLTQTSRSSTLYVALSRARSLLAVGRSIREKDNYERLLVAYGKRMFDGADSLIGAGA